MVKTAMHSFDDRKAVELFNDFRNSAQLMAGGTRGGCDWRAHLMGEELLAQTGLPVRKIWCWAEDEPMKGLINPGALNIIFVPSYDSAADNYSVGNNFHVAPFIETAKGEKLVFDPVAYDGPVELAQWQEDLIPVAGKVLKIKLTDMTGHRMDLTGNTISVVTKFNFAAQAKDALDALLCATQKEDIIIHGRSRWMMARQFS